ncbi:Multidrug resistance operon repressor [Sporomusa ovata DSM 2662]|uniref:MarR family winged helix-turn-helix transcriptional regulator n=1 Tax=Sporomusa ovata TaxID=2378 RepID=UPI0003883364|nr:MarR family transcriptional regulator [Sporomusa ovata]EQB27319.1 HTH-transcriptional regulator, MarR family [Sporomusa ovata DSM 2662]
MTSKILREVGTVARCIQSISDITYREIKLQRGQFIFLTRICEQPGINLIDLSQVLKVDKTTTTKAIQKLLEENYVQRKRDNADKRMWHLYPTEKAAGIYPYIINEENQNIDVCFAGFSQDEKEMVYHLVKRMGENIEQNWKTLKNNQG